MAETPQQEIARLRSELNRHNQLYYIQAVPEISDLEYDRLLQRLSELEAQHPEFDAPDSPTHKVGGAPVEGFHTVEHRLPMLSIDNVYDEAELREFDVRVRKLLQPGEPLEYAVEYKIDGVALALIYEKGVLVQALTRGDGRRGDDITHNARTLRGVPLRLYSENPPELLEVRGEAYISNPDFAHIRAEQQQRGVPLFANPRNTTAGAIKMLDPRECKARRLRFLAHGLGAVTGIEFPTHIAFLKQAQQYGLPITPRAQAFPDIDTALAYCQTMLEEVHSLDVEVDGLDVLVTEGDLVLRSRQARDGRHREVREDARLAEARQDAVVGPEALGIPRSDEMNLHDASLPHSTQAAPHPGGRGRTGLPCGGSGGGSQ